MEIHWDSRLVNLENLIRHSRGDQLKVQRYLQQFLTLIPPRRAALQVSLQAHDRKTTRQILHQMSPQLQFFGVPEVVAPIKRLGLEYQTMEWQELQSLAETILQRLLAACQEVERVLQVYFAFSQ